MPTFSRVVASLLYAGLAFYVSTLIVVIYDGERPLPNLAMWNAFFGIVVGWRVAGSRSGQGFNGAIGYGLTCTAALVLTCLFAHSFAEMIRRSMRGQYDGPSEAVIEVVNLMWEFAQRVATMEIITISLVGGLVAAFIVELFARRYD